MKIVTADITGSLIVNNVDVTNNVVSSSAFSSSIAQRVTTLEQFSSSLDATFATDASVSASILVLSQSVQTSQAVLSSSYATTSGSYAAASSSLSTRVTTIEGSYATTGSNQFKADQNITGSVTATGNVNAVGATFTNNISISGIAFGKGNQDASNVVIGNSALSYLSSATYNIAIGQNALFANGNSGNVAIGYEAGYYINYGANVMIGYQAGRGNGPTSNSVGIGYQALSGNSNGSSNIAIGYLAGRDIVGSNNVIIGGYTGTSMSNNVILADGAGSIRFQWDGSSILLNGSNYNSFSSSYATTSGSYATTSGSIAGRVTTIEGQYATTGSNTFTNLQYISSSTNAAGFTTSASLYTDGGLRVGKDSFVSGTAYFNNVVVYGTSSIQYITSSQVNVGANIINLNTQTPAVRFGGMAVADSGSNAGITGSMLWDSVYNRWIYSNPSGSSYDGGMIISGPKNTSGLGNELGTTSCALMMGQGGDHITSSAIFSYDNATCFYGNSYVSSSGLACFSGQVCALTGASLGSITSYSYGSTRGYIGDVDGDCNMQVRSETAFNIKTGGNNQRLSIASTGVACFSGKVCMGSLTVVGDAAFCSAGSTTVTLEGSTPIINLTRNNNTSSPAAQLNFKTSQGTVRWQIATNSSTGTGLEINQGDGVNRVFYIDTSGRLSLSCYLFVNGGGIGMDLNASITTISNYGYGGALQLLRSDATSTRWARIGMVDGGLNFLGGMTINNDTSATFDAAACATTLYASNCINIGTTTSLGSRLSIQSCNDQAGITMYNSYACNKWSLRTGTPGVSNNGFAIQDDICNLTRFQISSAGCVGIGALSPLAKLHVCSAYNGNNTSAIFANSNGSINYITYDTVVVQADDVTTLKLVERNVGSVDQVLTMAVGDGSSRISTTCSNPLQFFVGGSPAACGYNGLSGTNALSLSSTGAATFACSVTTGGNVSITKSTPGLVLNGTGYGNSGAYLQLLGWASANPNWQISVATEGDGSLHFVPSTTNGGSTFSSVVASIGGSGVGYFCNYVNTTYLNLNGNYNNSYTICSSGWQNQYVTIIPPGTLGVRSTYVVSVYFDNNGAGAPYVAGASALFTPANTNGSGLDNEYQPITSMHQGYGGGYSLWFAARAGSGQTSAGLAIKICNWATVTGGMTVKASVLQNV